MGLDQKSKDGRPGMPVRRVIAAVVVFYALVLALNAVALHESIERQPYGPARTFWLSVTGPPASASRALRLDRPRRFFRRTLGERINH